MGIIRRFKSFLIKALNKLIPDNMTESGGKSGYLKFRDALYLVYPDRQISDEDLGTLTQKWNRRATERWSGRRRGPVTSEDGSLLLPKSDGVCVIAAIVREWQHEEQQAALRFLELRLKQLRAFDEEEAEDDVLDHRTADGDWE
jgi:hypothetical protein